MSGGSTDRKKAGEAMKTRDIYDEITGKCGCGSRTYLVYQSTIIGGVDMINDTQMGIKHLAKDDQEQEQLIICSKCARVRVSKGVDFVANMIGE